VIVAIYKSTKNTLFLQLLTNAGVDAISQYIESSNNQSDFCFVSWLNQSDTYWPIQKPSMKINATNVVQPLVINPVWDKLIHISLDF
jgi:hypothetical protein